MADIIFESTISWRETGRNGKGKVMIDGKTVPFSSPAKMGGKGIGTSPEDLLIDAVTTCYSGTLYGVLAKHKLPVDRIEVRAEGIVSGYPLQTKFNQLIVHPTIIGGDELKPSEYKECAAIAKDKCFIGKTITGNVDYKVGTIEIFTIRLDVDRVDELVERFYQKLTKDDYFATMFTERKVDIEKLKDRQKIFIYHLINDNNSTSEQEKKEQVQKRHDFHTTPERGEIWLNTMETTMTKWRLKLRQKVHC